MKEPNKIPLDPTTPRAKDVKKIPLTKLYTDFDIDDDIYRPDRDSIYTIINDENNKKSTET